jgi:CheY-like chemotaxis protein
MRLFRFRKGKTRIDGPFSPKNARILVVEDNASEVALTRHILDTFGVRHWETARTADEAFGLLTKHEYQAAIIDFSLPGINGLELLRVIADRFPQTRVIVVSGAHDEEVAVEAMKLGAINYVCKNEFLTSGIFRSLQMALREAKQERDGALAPSSNLRESLAEADWLLEPSPFRHGMLEVSADWLANSAADQLFLSYLRSSISGFPRRATEEEDALIDFVVSQGFSPDAVIALYRKALTDLELDGGQLPFSPLLLLSQVLKRMVEESQQQLAVVAASGKSRAV